MFSYVARRVLQMIPLILGITVVLFAVIQAAPGGPEAALLESDRFIDPAVIEAYRERLGVDQPVPVQYIKWVTSAAMGDLGTSFSTTRPVSEMILERLPATLELMGASFLLAAILAFWFALILQLVFGVWLGWLPVAGTETVGATGFVDHIAHLVLPAFVLSFRYVAGWSRYLRSSLLGVLTADYIRTARAKGLPERSVVGVHALRNAMIPVVSVMALNMAGLFSGAVITETVFAWPGIGRMFVQAMFSRDYPLLMGILLLGSVMVVVFNLLADVLYAVLDPRIRYE
jgi:peptide/nickel transport system permease protein